MEDMSIVDIVFNIIITAFIYMVAPIIIFYKSQEGFTKKKVKKIVILNSIAGYIVFIILFIMLKDDGSAPKGYSAFFYGYINYWLLSKRVKDENEEYIKEDEEENKKLENLINTLQKENK